MSEQGSVASLDSLCSEGCPAAPSLLYDQRDLVYETRQHQSNRRALTAYRTYKSRGLIGEVQCTERAANLAKRVGFQRSQTYRQFRREKIQETIFTHSSMEIDCAI